MRGGGAAKRRSSRVSTEKGQKMTLKMSTEGNKTPLNFIMRVVWYLLGGRDFPVEAVHFISHPP